VAAINALLLVASAEVTVTVSTGVPESAHPTVAEAQQRVAGAEGGRRQGGGRAGHRRRRAPAVRRGRGRFGAAPRRANGARGRGAATRISGGVEIPPSLFARSAANPALLKSYSHNLTYGGIRRRRSGRTGWHTRGTRCRTTQAPFALVHNRSRDRPLMTHAHWRWWWTQRTVPRRFDTAS